jgi:hypothetical protein
MSDKKKKDHPKAETFELTVGERLRLVQILSSARGNIATVRILEELRTQIGLTEFELARFGVTEQSNGTITWAYQGTCPIDLTQKKLDIIKEELQKLDSQRSLGIEHLALWEKFVGAEG